MTCRVFKIALASWPDYSHAKTGEYFHPPNLRHSRIMSEYYVRSLDQEIELLCNSDNLFPATPFIHKKYEASLSRSQRYSIRFAVSIPTSIPP